MPPSKSVELHLQLLSYWRSGEGRGAGVRHDAVCARDPLGLPYLPGRQIKGLLRDAVRRDPRLGDEERDGWIDWLFGEDGHELGLPKRDTQPGALAFSNARLGRPTLQWFERQTPSIRENRSQELYQTLHQTAIDHDSGAAKEKSLRSIEVAVPVELVSTISCDDPGADDSWISIISQVLPLVKAVGAHRSRGLGRASLSLHKGMANAAA